MAIDISNDRLRQISCFSRICCLIALTLVLAASGSKDAGAGLLRESVGCKAINNGAMDLVLLETTNNGSASAAVGPFAQGDIILFRLDVTSTTEMDFRNVVNLNAIDPVSTASRASQVLFIHQGEFNSGLRETIYTVDSRTAGTLFIASIGTVGVARLSFSARCRSIRNTKRSIPVS